MLNKLAILGFFLATTSGAFGLESLNNQKKPFALPKLGYEYSALESFVDEQTMIIHHTKHHQGYIDKLNNNLQSNKITLEIILKNISQHSVAIRNNAGGHWNHSFFWSILAEKADESKISEELLSQIKNDFGSLKNLKDLFQNSALSLFGSGWTWLIVGEKGKLQIVNTPNQDNPLMDTSPVKGLPILGVDVWEHAYYLQYQDLRKSYLENFWKNVNWSQVSSHFAQK